MNYPSKSKILSYLFTLEENDPEFYDLIGKTFRLKPRFFMEKLYTRFRKTIRKAYGLESIRLIEKQILEKFCLDEGEQILFECDGSIIFTLEERYNLKVTSGSVFVTNQRIIAQGSLTSAGLMSEMSDISLLVPLIGTVEGIGRVVSGWGSPKKAKKALIDLSVNQELPCYGYIFPIIKPFNVKQKKRSIYYNVIYQNLLFLIKISCSSSKAKSDSNDLFELFRKADTGKRLYLETFYFGGKLKYLKLNHAKKLVQALGGIVKSGTKDLSYIVTNKPKSKFIKFQERGTEILTEEEFLELLEGKKLNTSSNYLDRITQESEKRFYELSTRKRKK